MTEEQAPIHAPEFPSGAAWLQNGPQRMADLRGNVVLLDFWDYTCVNCIRTLPYLNEWYRRYQSLGLRVIGVHAPEFSFAREPSNVQRAVREHAIAYPVVLDNDYAIWQSWANRYWPAKYLIDGNGYLRYYHFGEGKYSETEAAIQALLRESFAEVLLPGIMEPLRPEDHAGAMCYRVTPEVYLGYARTLIGNAEITPDKPAAYRDPGMHMDGYAYLAGDWLVSGEYAARPAGGTGISRLTLPYVSKDVNLVAHPPAYGGEATVSVMQDGAPLSADDAGPDVSAGAATSVMTVDAPRMYRVVANREIGRHELTLETASDGVALYAFTFTSCVLPD